MARLNNDQKHELAQLLAERRTHVFIVKYFNDIHNLLIYDSQIMKYKRTKKWIEIIQEKRETWDKDLGSEHLASKRNRLIALEEARESAIKGGFTGTDKESGKEIHKNSPAAAVAAVKQAQEEMEGKQVRLADADGSNITSLAQLFAGIPQLIQLLHDRLALSGVGQKRIKGG